MEGIRKPYQGVWNIIRFNWHFYVIAIAAILFLVCITHYCSDNYCIYINALCGLISLPIIISLGVSYYVYDLSQLYRLTWMDSIDIPADGQMINVHAGFDETSILLEKKFPEAKLTVYDFYDPAKHTEISIKRARRAYSPFGDTHRINTSSLPLNNDSIDTIFVTLSAHEIRNDKERYAFFKEMKRVLKSPGQIIVTEHLRDSWNLAAYNIGFFHFLSRSIWYKTFGSVELTTTREIKITPFITTFILSKNGTAP